MNDLHIPTERLIDYLHGELSPGEDVRVLTHIESCATCRATYELEARLNDALRTYGSSELELPRGVVATIWDRVERDRTPVWQTRLAWIMRPALSIPVAAAFAVALFVGVANVHSGHQPSIDAAYYLDDHAALTKSVPFGEESAVVVPTSLERDDPEADQRWVATSDSASTNDTQ